MNSWASPDGAVAAVAIVTLLGGAIMAYFQVVIGGLKEKNRDLIARLDGLAVKKDELEKRLATVEREAVTRPELERITASIEKLGASMGQDFKDLGHRIDDFVGRLAKVEASTR